MAAHQLVTCASPEYLERCGTPEILEDLAKHNCLAFDHGGRAAEWRFQVDGVRRMVRIGGNFVSTQAEALRDATTAGLGIGQLATFLISDELRTGRLVPVLVRHATEGEPLSIIYPIRTLLPPRVKAFVDLLSRSWQPVPPWDRN